MPTHATRRDCIRPPPRRRATVEPLVDTSCAVDPRRVSWCSMTDAQFEDTVQKIVYDENIPDAKTLSERCPGLSVEFKKRGYPPESFDYCPKPYEEAPKSEIRAVKGRKGPYRSWDTECMEDEEVLERAQDAIDEREFPDYDSFAAVYKGIAFQISKRGLSTESLVFHPEEERDPLEEAEEILCTAKIVDGKLLITGFVPVSSVEDIHEPGSQISAPQWPVKDWDVLEDQDVLDLAQARVESDGIRDKETFISRYRGINYQLHKRGYSADQLRYPE